MPLCGVRHCDARPRSAPPKTRPNKKTAALRGTPEAAVSGVSIGLPASPGSGEDRSGAGGQAVGARVG